MNHVNRSWSWAVLGLLVAVHLWPASPPAWLWLALALQFLLYPHLLFWRARRAQQPFRAEMHNMLLDAGVLGAWSAALGFPLWIAFLFGIGPCINLVAFQGARGVFRALAAHCLGAAVVGLLAAAWLAIVLPQGVRGPADLAITIPALLCLHFTRLNVLWIVLPVVILSVMLGLH